MNATLAVCGLSTEGQQDVEDRQKISPSIFFFLFPNHLLPLAVALPLIDLLTCSFLCTLSPPSLLFSLLVFISPQFVPHLTFASFIPHITSSKSIFSCVCRFSQLAHSVCLCLSALFAPTSVFLLWSPLVCLLHPEGLLSCWGKAQ